MCKRNGTCIKNGMYIRRQWNGICDNANGMEHVKV